MAAAHQKCLNKLEQGQHDCIKGVTAWTQEKTFVFVKQLLVNWIGLLFYSNSLCARGQFASFPDFNIVIKSDREAEKRQTAEVGSVITADTISWGRLPWYPAAAGCSLIGWPALVSQQYSVSFFPLSFYLHTCCLFPLYHSSQCCHFPLHSPPQSPLFL